MQFTHGYNEYTVAIDTTTGNKINVWKGHRFRPYDVTKVTQFKVQGDLNEELAVERATRLWSQFQNVRK